MRKISLKERVKINRNLRKVGIEKTREFTVKEITYMAYYITNALINTFPILEEKYNDILAQMLHCKMYYAKVPSNLPIANYIYEEDGIYFDERFEPSNIDDLVIHECIHYLQVDRKSNQKAKQMGLCEFKEFSILGLGINEAAVSYISSKIKNNKIETIKRYGINLPTVSPKYYPMITNLIEQIIYLLGEDLLIKATINCNPEFKDEFLNTFEENAIKIVKNFDQMLNKYNKTLEAKEEKGTELKKEMAKLYLETQQLIYITYFNKICNRVTKLEEVYYYMEKFLQYKDFMGIEEENLYHTNHEYEIYKDVIMEKFEKKIIRFNLYKNKNAIAIIYHNKLKRLLKKIISYFYG